MSVKQTIRDQILNDLNLRLKIALALGIGEESVKRAAERNSGSLTKVAAVNVLKKELGLTEAQIFEVDTINN